MRKDLVIRAAGAVLGAALLVTSCSSSTKSTTTPSPTPSPTSAGLSPSPSAGPTGTAPADTAAATQQITQNWQNFFSPSTSITAKAGLLQNGTQLLPLLQGFASDPEWARSAHR